MLLRIKQNPDSSKIIFEINALRVTGIAFYILSVGLLFGIVINLINHHKPETGF